jgi:hypothetical protein
MPGAVIARPRAAPASTALCRPYASELLPSAAVDGLADDVRMPSMPGYLLDVVISTHRRLVPESSA